MLLAFLILFLGLLAYSGWIFSLGHIFLAPHIFYFSISNLIFFYFLCWAVFGPNLFLFAQFLFWFPFSTLFYFARISLTTRSVTFSAPMPFCHLRQRNPKASFLTNSQHLAKQLPHHISSTSPFHTSSFEKLKAHGPGEGSVAGARPHSSFALKYFCSPISISFLHFLVRNQDFIPFLLVPRSTLLSFRFFELHCARLVDFNKNGMLTRENGKIIHTCYRFHRPNGFHLSNLIDFSPILDFCKNVCKFSVFWEMSLTWILGAIIWIDSSQAIVNTSRFSPFLTFLLSICKDISLILSEFDQFGRLCE